MTVEINGSREQRIASLAQAHKVELEEEVLNLLDLAIWLEENYQAQKLREKIPEQV